MNLETIEQRCLAYLQETRRPLAPIGEILAHLREDEDCADVDEVELLRFLRKHELFTVIEPQGFAADDGGTPELEAAGIANAPSVVLTTRLPSKTELKHSMQEQMGTMLNALESAMNLARGENNPKLAMEVQAILKRARELQAKLDNAGSTGCA